jgi:hypothetical protein
MAAEPDDPRTNQPVTSATAEYHPSTMILTDDIAPTRTNAETSERHAVETHPQELLECVSERPSAWLIEQIVNKCQRCRPTLAPESSIGTFAEKPTKAFQEKLADISLKRPAATV